MAKRKSKHADFITICEMNHRLHMIADTSMPSCNMYDIINGAFIVPEKSVLRKNRHPDVLQNLTLYLLHTVFVDILLKNRSIY